MTTDNAFLAAIAAAPDDDTPRLVYADWLDEHDRPGNAAYLRLEAEFAALTPDAAGYADRLARLDELRTRLDRAWVDAAGRRYNVALWWCHPRRKAWAARALDTLTGMGLGPARLRVNAAACILLEDLPFHVADAQARSFRLQGRPLDPTVYAEISDYAVVRVVPARQARQARPAEKAPYKVTAADFLAAFAADAARLGMTVREFMAPGPRGPRGPRNPREYLRYFN